MLMCFEMDEFFSWLASHHDEESVSLPGQCFHSLLARFLSHKAGFTIGVEGKRYGWALADECRWLELPRWAQAFAVYSERLFGRDFSAYEWLTCLSRSRSCSLRFRRFSLVF
jgi:hypothetical protein